MPCCRVVFLTSTILMVLQSPWTLRVRVVSLHCEHSWPILGALLTQSSHLGCQSIRNGEAKMSLIAASQLILVPDMPTALSSLHMLSPDSRCYS